MTTPKHKEPSRRLTFGEILSSGAVIELLSGSRLLLWNGTSPIVATEVEFDGTTYVPRDLGEWRSISLPASFGDPPEPEELVLGLERMLGEYGLEQTSARLASFFVLATWFADLLPWVPSVIVHGPVDEGLQLLQALTRLCRRGIFLPRVSARLLDSIPRSLWPTIVVAGPTLHRNAQDSLRASSRRLCCPAKDALAYSRVLYCSENNVDMWLSAISIHINVPQSGLIPATAGDVRTERLVSLLLGYRLRHLEAVRASDSDAPQFHANMRSIARGLLACVTGSIKLHAEILDLLIELDEEYRGEQDGTVRNVLIETLLSFCHEQPSAPVFVHDISERLAAIFEGRGDHIRISPRAVGAGMKFLGIRTRRVAGGAGRGLCFDASSCARIHRLAAQFGIPLDQEKVRNCQLCHAEDIQI